MLLYIFVHTRVCLQVRQLIEREVTLEEGCRAIEAMDHGSPLGITVVTGFGGEAKL